MDKKIRNGNFEVLRIISIIFIILHHYVFYGNLMNVDGTEIVNNLLGNFLYIGGKIGVHIFILITGYFMIQSKFKIKKVIKLILETVFYIVLLEITYVYILKQKTEIEIVWRGYWFVNEYITIYVLSPFINKLLKSCNKKQIQILILILIIFSQIYVKGNLYLLIISYIIGAYISMYSEEFSKIKAGIWALFALINWLIIFELMIIIAYSKFEIDYRKFAQIDSIFEIMAAFSMFMCFKGLNIKNDKVIQFIASSSFGVYLLHESTPNRTILWMKILECDKFYFVNPLKLIAHIFMCVGVIYLVALCIELVRVYVFEKVIFKVKVLDKYFDKIDNLVNISQ